MPAEAPRAEAPPAESPRTETPRAETPRAETIPPGWAPDRERWAAVRARPAYAQADFGPFVGEG